MIYLFLLLIGIFSVSSLDKSSEPIYIKPYSQLTLAQHPKYFQEFCFYKGDIVPNKQYDIKVSYMGSIGAKIELMWITDDQTLEQLLKTFKPMDTEKLRFNTVNDRVGYNSSLDKYCFYVVAYRISKARDEQALNEKIRYIIEMEEVWFDDLPTYALVQYLGTFILAIIATAMTLRVLKHNKWLRSFLEPQQIKQE